MWKRFDVGCEANDRDHFVTFTFLRRQDMSRNVLFAAVVAAVVSAVLVVIISKMLNLDSTVGGAIGGAVGAATSVFIASKRKRGNEQEPGDA